MEVIFARMEFLFLFYCLRSNLLLTSIAGLVHVNDLDLTTQILVSPCDTCSVYTQTASYNIPNRSNMERSKSGL